MKDYFYESSVWSMLRYKTIKKYGRKCMCCGASGRGVVIQVDHIKPRSKYPELAEVESNLQVLCEPCNTGKGNRHEDDFTTIGEIAKKQIKKMRVKVSALTPPQKEQLALCRLSHYLKRKLAAADSSRDMGEVKRLSFAFLDVQKKLKRIEETFK